MRARPSVIGAAPPSPPATVASSSSPPSPALPAPPASPLQSARQREKRIPSVTPRRFRSFFTPRSLRSPRHRTALRSLPSEALNRKRHKSPQTSTSSILSSDPIFPSSPLDGHQASCGLGEAAVAGELPGPPPKRIKRDYLDDLVSLPLDYKLYKGKQRVPDAPREPPPGGSVKIKEKAIQASHGVVSDFFKARRRSTAAKSLGLVEPSPERSAAVLEKKNSLANYTPCPVRRFRRRGLESDLVDREHGSFAYLGQQTVATPTCPSGIEVARFFSTHFHYCEAILQEGNAIPFSLASAHNSTCTAIGDEHGFLRIFDTSNVARNDSEKVTSVIKLHENAIMDMDFSADDLRLASACGDRTGRVLDVKTSKNAVELRSGHADSLRQVAFQPGDLVGSVLASSDRAGCVQIWDLRSSSLPAQCFSTGGPQGTTRRDEGLALVPGATVNNLSRAHERVNLSSRSPASVTAIKWLPPGREHLLLTASEANACIKLWDTRFIKHPRQAADVPLATTPPPVTHDQRSYGITSLALSTDASRFYSVCKDNTIYAYSTNHLLLGHAPALDHHAVKRRPTGAQGLGPLYGFRDDSFRVGSFYVKCTLRRPRGLDTELLAVGSSNACAILFPTDERYLRRLGDGQPGPHDRQGSPSTSLPIFRTGTPLIHGHSREVTTVSWSATGQLVTASDDYFIRQWDEDAVRARYLREVGDYGIQRHLTGWADAPANWDLEEG